jgi:hypothetical protein
MLKYPELNQSGPTHDTTQLPANRQQGPSMSNDPVSYAGKSRTASIHRAGEFAAPGSEISAVLLCPAVVSLLT